KMGIRVVMVRRGVRRHACFQCSGLWVPTMPSPHADLRILVDHAAEPVASSDAEVLAMRMRSVRSRRALGQPPV
ncbi:MAG TPA: hypothetical protein VMK13_02325, partial [Streptosporangiaceae bacterium]|nr:hypothetical protein [Streptosporangiaceae bacterium]